MTASPMTTTLPLWVDSASSLPQYGFDTCVDFDTLLKSNHFLFRVYTPRERSPFFDDTDPFFIAPKFNERYNRSPLEPSHNDVSYYRGTYDDVVKHMDWTSRSSSPFISTSFSFIWSIWEALRRYHQGIKKDIQIAVIDAAALSGRAATAIELLRKSDPSERNNKYWKWSRFSQESQSVLIYESIPGTAVLASIPLLSLIEKLPSYFLQSEVSYPLQQNSLAAVAWNYAERKQSYRQFCQSMSTRFLQLSPEVRLQDTIAGSVRLALAFLRPWFHKCVADDFQTAIVMLCALAFSIARWPGQWWTQEHSEIWELIRAVVLSVAEEIRAKHQGIIVVEVTRLQDMIAELKERREVEQHQAAAITAKLQDEISELEMVREAELERVWAESGRLRNTIDELEEAVKKYESELLSRERKKSSRSLTPLMIPPPLGPAPIAISPSPMILAPLSSVSLSHPRIIPTPITPPTSPIRSTAPAFPIETPIVPDASPSPTSETSTLHSQSASLSPTIQESTTPTLEYPSLAKEEELHTQATPPREEPVNLPPLPPLPPLPVTSLEKGFSEPSLPVESIPSEPRLPVPDQAPLPLELDDTFRAIPAYVTSSPLSPYREPRPRGSSTFTEAASCIVTGFLVGAFITLCLLSPQRRTLLTNLT